MEVKSVPLTSDLKHKPHQQATESVENLLRWAFACLNAAPALQQHKHLEVLKRLMTPAESHGSQSRPRFMCALGQSERWPAETGGPVGAPQKERRREEEKWTEQREEEEESQTFWNNKKRKKSRWKEEGSAGRRHRPVSLDATGWPEISLRCEEKERKGKERR